MDRDVIKQTLKTGETIVRFIKANGELREMRCTLNAGMIPVVESDVVHKSPRTENPDVQAVWDLDKQAWRSFRYDSVKELVI